MMSLQQVTLDQLIKPAKLRRAGNSIFPILSMTMHEGLVEQVKKFKKRVASSDTSQYKVVKRNQLVVGFPIDEGVLSFQYLFDEAVVSPAYDIWDLRNDEQVDSKYLERFLRSPRALNFYKSKLRGTTARRRTLPNDIFLSLIIPLPHLAEQKRIADILDRAEALRAKRRAALAQLDELTQSIFIEMFGEPVKNPKNWKLEKVCDVISQIEAGWSANGESRPREESEYAVLKVSAVTQGVFMPEECKVINNDIEFKKVVTPEKGDVLFSRANTLELVGASCLISENYPYLLLPDKLWKIRVNEEKIYPEYFKFVLSYPTIRHEISKRSTGTSGSMYNISMDKFRLIKIIVPPISLQCEFTRHIASMEKLKAAHKASLTELDELFSSLQYRAFRGEL